jgi:hypothetical protein
LRNAVDAFKGRHWKKIGCILLYAVFLTVHSFEEAIIIYFLLYIQLLCPKVCFIFMDIIYVCFMEESPQLLVVWPLKLVSYSLLCIRQID